MNKSQIEQNTANIEETASQGARKAREKAEEWSDKAKSKYEEFSQKASETYDQVSEKASEKYDEMRARIKDQVNVAIDKAMDSSRRTGQAVKGYAQQNPLQSAGIAFLAGIFLGYIFTRPGSSEE